MIQDLRIKNKSSIGFTLVEVLVVLVLLVSVGALIGSILFSAFRGASKTDVLQVVRQNGNFTISQIAKTIRNAKQFDGVSNDVGGSYINNCVLPLPTPPTPTPTPTLYKYIKVTSLDNISTTYTCDTDVAKNILANGSPLLDTKNVFLASCSFTCVQNSLSDSPTITIQIGLSQAGGVSLFAEKTATLNFQTSIAIRNPLR